MLIDSHAHLEDYEDIDEVIKRAEEFGVKKIIASSYSFDTCKRALELAQKYNNVFATMGIHPSNAYEYSTEIEEFIKSQAKRIVAIGEIGLDYHFEPFDKGLQKDVFIRQIKLADSLGLPIVVHMRDATQDTLDIIKEQKPKKVLIHCFNGSVETLNEVMKRGYYVSFGGAITFKNAKNFKELLKNVDLGHVLLETDSPYLCPEPFRGQRNEPKNVLYVCKKIAEEQALSEQEVCDITTQNAIKFYEKIG